MPVLGLSDRNSVDPRFQEIGRIRKGAPKNGNRPGADLSYFRYVPDSRHQESGDVFQRIYGDEPTTLEVYFPFDQMERVFSSWREAYGQNRLCKLRCDGERWHDWIKEDKHYHSEQGRECDLEFRDSENRCPGCPCQYVGRLSVILGPMWEEGQIGLVTVITSSINDIANLAAKLVQWEPLTGKPFTLWRAPERIGVPIKGKRAGKDSDLLHLELSNERMWQEFQASKERAAAQLLPPQEPPMITADPDWDEIENEPYDDELITGDPFLDADFNDAPMGTDEYDELPKAEQEPSTEPVQTVPHWTEVQDWKRFHAVIKGGLGLSNDDIHTALGVESSKNYRGTKDEAWNALVKFAVQVVEHWADYDLLKKEWHEFLNSIPEDKRPSPANAAAMIADLPGGTLTDFDGTLDVAMNIIRGKLEL